MNDLLQKLENYGVNLSVVMSRFINDEELYTECIYEFMKDPCFDNLKAAVESRDYDAAFNCTHTLKGVSANLGLAPLNDVISRLVEPLRHKDYSNVERLCERIFTEKEALQVLLS